jgi:hypothetical protein
VLPQVHDPLGIAVLDPRRRANGFTRDRTHESVVDAVIYTASPPLDADVLFITLMAIKMPFVGRG